MNSSKLDIFQNIDRMEKNTVEKIEGLIKVTKELIENADKQKELTIKLLIAILQKNIELLENEVLIFNDVTFEYKIINSGKWNEIDRPIHRHKDYKNFSQICNFSLQQKIKKGKE